VVRRRWEVLDEDELHDQGSPEDVDRRFSAYRRAVPYLLAGWTLLVWIGRVRNIVDADGATAELVVPLLLVVLGVATLVRPARFAPLLALVTAIVWLVRLPLLLVHDHTAAFVVVHLVLAAVSLTLAALTLRGRARRPVRV
jgi:hypothetical protein